MRFGLFFRIPESGGQTHARRYAEAFTTTPLPLLRECMTHYQAYRTQHSASPRRLLHETVLAPGLHRAFLTTSPVNFRKHKDTGMDELYQKQSWALDPDERKRYLRAFEKRLYDEEVHYIMTFQWHRIVPHLAKVRGWQITPSHYLNNQLDTVWLSE